jgi:hypothetical protein
MSRPRTPTRLIVILALSAGLGAALGLSGGTAVSAKEIVNLVCTGSNHVTGKVGRKTIEDEELPWRQHYTLDDDGTFIALTGSEGGIEKGKLTITSRRYFLDYDSTDPEIKRNGGGLYIDRGTGALYAIGVKRDGNHVIKYISTGQCKVDQAEPKF